MSRRSALIARGAALQVVARILGIPLSLVSLAIATRYLGEHGYGVLTTAVVFAGLFETFTELGVGTVIVRRVSGEGASLQRLVGLNLALSIGYAIPLALIAGSVGLLIYSGDTQTQLAVVIVCAGLLFTSVATCYNPVFEVHVQFGYVALAEFVSRLATVCAAIAVVYTDAGLLAMCAVQVIPPVLRMIITIMGARRIARFKLVASGPEIWSLLKESFPLTLSLAIAILYWRADGALLSMLSDVHQVAAYGLAYATAFAVTGIIPQVFARTIMSTIAESYTTDSARFRRSVDAGYRFLLMCAVPVVVLGWPLAERGIRLIASEEFVDATTPVLRLFLIAAALSFLTEMVSVVCSAAGHLGYLARLSVINLVANIALNVLLIPWLGAVGAGIALIVSELVGVVLPQWRMRKLGAGLLPLPYVLRLVPSLVLAGGLMWLTWSLPLVVPFLAGLIGYAIGVWVSGAVPEQIRTLVEQLARKIRPSREPAQ